VAPYPDKQGAAVKEIQEFAPREVFVPYVTYRLVVVIFFIRNLWNQLVNWSFSTYWLIFTGLTWINIL